MMSVCGCSAWTQAAVQKQNWIWMLHQWGKLKILDLQIKEEIQFKTKNCANRMWLLDKLSGLFVQMPMVRTPLWWGWMESIIAATMLNESVTVLDMAIHIHHYRLDSRERTLYFWHKGYYRLSNLQLLSKLGLFNPWWGSPYHTESLLTLTYWVHQILTPMLGLSVVPHQYLLVTSRLLIS